MHGAELIGTQAQRFGEVFRVIELCRQQHSEAISGYACAEGAARQTLTYELAELSQHGVAHVHAQVIVDYVQLVDVDVECGPMPRTAFVDDDATHALFEGGAHVQTTQRIEAAFDDANGLPRQDVPEACVAIQAILADFLAKQRQYTDG